MSIRQELSSLIYELKEVHEKLIYMDEVCEYKETSKLLREAIKNVDAELQKHKDTLKHFAENNPDTIKEISEEEERNKEEFGWNGRIYEQSLYE